MQRNILLSAINAKYIHSGLAARYLKKYCESDISNIAIAEFSINDSIGSILKKLYRSGALIFGFSCYIWNISLVLNICSSLKKAIPDAIIILGGPEVSYDPVSLLAANSAVDYVVIGEGEQTLLELLKYIRFGDSKLDSIPGIAYRQGADVVTTGPRPLIASLDEIPFPYDSFDGLDNRIIYYETSRGCPFNCQYCLSSTIHGVRYLSMDRLRNDIQKFTAAGIKQVKLVDRTFNCNIDRSTEIMEYIIKLNPATNFHFEIAADLINERFLETAAKAPAGLFQYEIGVQSTNPRTLSEIKRVMDFDKVAQNVRKLVSFGNAHLHLDLIAGLPYEDIKSFEKSFNDVYSLKPDMLQLGFLKLLKGSGIREKSPVYGMEHHDFPPYEVIRTDWISYGDLLVLKDVEHVLEQYGNSGRFRHTLDFLLESLEISPFEFYHSLAEFWNQMDFFHSSKGVNDLYNIMKHFVYTVYSSCLGPVRLMMLNEYLKLDWLLYSRSGSMPDAIERYDHSPIKERLQEYLKDNVITRREFEAYRNMPLRELLKHIGYEVFTMDIFSSRQEKKEVVLYYPLRQKPHLRKPYYTPVPLSDILQKQ